MSNSSATGKSVETMEKLVALAKRRGFIFQSSEIYGGLNGFWDYGPYGAELKRNIKESWWTTMTRKREDVVGLDATIIMHPKIWKASGHVDTFADLMRECPLTRKRVRADQVDPQTGIVYRFHGAFSKETGFKVQKPFAILLRKGENPDSIRKKAREFYAAGNPDKKSAAVNDLQLEEDEKRETVTDSVDFHPESGAMLSEARPFNLMLQTYVGPIQSEENIAYLRPETAQAIFVQFKNVVETSRQKVPFGIAQMGKAFRNEVTPRNFTFRSREFEQMELEFFIKPDEAVEVLCGSVAKVKSSGHPGEPQSDWGWEAWHKYWVEERIAFYETIGLPRTVLEEYWQKPEELAHYAKATVDILVQFPFGTQELEGIAARGDFDLSQHQKFSGKSLEFFDEELKAAWAKLDETRKEDLHQRFVQSKTQAWLKKQLPEADARAEAEKDAKAFFEKLARGIYIPHVIEPSAGVDRLALAILCNAFAEETITDENGKTDTRTVLRLSPVIAPVKVAVFPLLRNKPDLVAKARQVFELLRREFAVEWDDSGNVGKRYRRQDEIGTPYCVTVDFETLGEKGESIKDTVTVRDRDTMKQERIAINALSDWLKARLRV